MPIKTPRSFVRTRRGVRADETLAGFRFARLHLQECGLDAAEAERVAKLAVKQFRRRRYLKRPPVDTFAPSHLSFLVTAGDVL